MREYELRGVWARPSIPLSTTAIVKSVAVLSLSSHANGCNPDERIPEPDWAHCLHGFEPKNKELFGNHTAKSFVFNKRFRGSPAWIRTTIHGSKGRCPTIRRPGN